ncbi:MAG: hypothetical protein CM15mP120_00580 [Pseudomonadota bacterium]|nr:MAG: hypothetical protein CM15mP120_00580 [Pseudomonadota bacterium]
MTAWLMRMLVSPMPSDAWFYGHKSLKLSWRSGSCIDAVSRKRIAKTNSARTSAFATVETLKALDLFETQSRAWCAAKMSAKPTAWGSSGNADVGFIAWHN